ncbi:hypothetical protein NXX61_21340 [Bacteroides ovatus]|nr:hypothetical protein [Bacteroides ovatus]
MLKAKYFILLICFSFLLKTEAKVTLTSIWGDNMVLQQQSEVTFSGTATSGKRVQATASWNNKKSKRMLMQKVNGNFLSKHR